MLDKFTENIPFFDTVVFGNSINNYFESLLFVLASYFIGVFIKFFVLRYLKKLAKKTENIFDDYLVEIASTAIIWLSMILGILFAVNHLTLPEVFVKIVNSSLYIILTIKATFLVNNIIHAFFEDILIPYSKKHKMLDEEIIVFLNKLIKGIVWIIMGISILSFAGYNITSLVAGLGIGGLAIALAAQTTLSNFFGSLYIFSDRPFKVGDFIKFGNTKATIKEVGIRSTRMETIDGTRLMVPNSELASTIIENISKRKTTRVDLQLGVEYSTTTKKMEEAIKIIKEIVKKDPEVEDECRVNFLEFGESSLNLNVTMFVKENKDYDNILCIRSRVNLELKKKFEKAKIIMAFPTRTLFINNN